MIHCISLFIDRHAAAEPKVREEEEVKFKEVSEAYSVLSDHKKKIRYDNGQDLEEGMGTYYYHQLTILLLFSTRY